jgi:hypothetical protein
MLSGRSSSCFGLLTPTSVQHPLVVLHCSSVVLRRNCLQELPERWDRTADDDFLTTNNFLIFCRNCRRRLSYWSTFRDTKQSCTHCSQLRSILPRPPKKEEKKNEFCKFLLKFSPRAVSGCIVEGSRFSIIPEERIVYVGSNIINNVSSSQHIDGGVKKPPPKRTFSPGYPQMLHPKNNLSWRSWVFYCGNNNNNPLAAALVESSSCALAFGWPHKSRKSMILDSTINQVGYWQRASS